MWRYCTVKCTLWFNFTAALDLNVTIAISPPGLVHDAATYLVLECQVSNAVGSYSYQWSSDCTGNCFVMSQISPVISRNALRSADSGNHTCMVTDSVGNSGIQTVSIDITGKTTVSHESCICDYFHPLYIGFGLSVNGMRVLTNNSITQSDTNGRIPDILCLSGSAVAGIGSWISPNDTYITNSSNDPFEVTVGGSEDPGSLEITAAVFPAFEESNHGVYTCSMSDHLGHTQNFHVGIYTAEFSGWLNFISTM